MYRKVRFWCSIPAPWGDGYVLPESRTGTARIAEALASNVQSVSPVEQHKYYGWGFWSTIAGATFHNVVNPIAEDEWWMTVSMKGYLWRKLTFRRPRRTFERYCAVLREALGCVHEISHVEWREFRS